MIFCRLGNSLSAQDTHADGPTQGRGIPEVGQRSAASLGSLLRQGRGRQHVSASHHPPVFAEMHRINWLSQHIHLQPATTPMAFPPSRQVPESTISRQPEIIQCLQFVIFRLLIIPYSAFLSSFHEASIPGNRQLYFQLGSC